MNYRTIKIYAGMTDDFVIIWTNATDEAIERQLKERNDLLESGQEIENAYELLESEGYTVNEIACADDTTEEELNDYIIDAEFDLYDY